MAFPVHRADVGVLGDLAAIFHGPKAICRDWMLGPAGLSETPCQRIWTPCLQQLNCASFASTVTAILLNDTRPQWSAP